MMIDTAIILSGGLGTRLRPLTETTPKPLLPIQGIPMIEHIILNARKYGVTRFILSVGYKAEMIKTYFGDGTKWGITISYCVEDTPLGTGGAVREAALGLNSPFLLMWGDNLHDVHVDLLSSTFFSSGCPIAMTLVTREDVENFGVARVVNGCVMGFVEKPSRALAPSNLINAGVFIIDPTVLSMLPAGICSMEKDCFEKVAAQGQIAAFVHSGQWFPTDTLEKYEIAGRDFQRK